MNEQDRRVKRTQRLLGAALLELMGEQNYDAITIRDITERADIAYATFFRHYKSKDDLLLHRLDGMMQQLDALALQSSGPYYRSEGILIFEHMLEHSDFYRNIFESASFIKRLRERLTEVMLTDIQRKNPPATPIPIEIIAHHLAASLLALMEWWLTHRQPYPPEQMGEIYEQLIIKGTWSVIPPKTPS